VEPQKARNVLEKISSFTKNDGCLNSIVSFFGFPNILCNRSFSILDLDVIANFSSLLADSKG
jgi:hypothetical protein